MTNVVCAIIITNNKVICVQRGEDMLLPMKWEFPGGKVEPGETDEAALVREIAEELELQIKPVLRLEVSLFSYHHTSIRLMPFVCTISGGKLFLKEHSGVRYLDCCELEKLDWAEADKPIVREVIERANEFLAATRHF